MEMDGSPGEDAGAAVDMEPDGRCEGDGKMEVVMREVDGWGRLQRWQ